MTLRGSCGNIFVKRGFENQLTRPPPFIDEETISGAMGPAQDGSYQLPPEMTKTLSPSLNACCALGALYSVVVDLQDGCHTHCTDDAQRGCILVHAMSAVSGNAVVCLCVGTCEINAYVPVDEVPGEEVNEFWDRFLLGNQNCPLRMMERYRRHIPSPLQG